MQGLIFHTLKGIRGWSSLNISTIDVHKVINIEHKKRLFCLFDRQYPYSLEIVYNEPTEIPAVAPVFNPRSHAGVGHVVLHNTYLTQTITKRYATEKEVQTEIAEIEAKQEKLNLIHQRIVAEIKEKYFA